MNLSAAPASQDMEETQELVVELFRESWPEAIPDGLAATPPLQAAGHLIPEALHGL